MAACRDRMKREYRLYPGCSDRAVPIRRLQLSQAGDEEGALALEPLERLVQVDREQAILGVLAFR